MRAASKPRRTKTARDAARGRLQRDRAAELASRFSVFMLTEWRAGRACTVFAYEGSLRHALRALLCLQGWRWRIADEVAGEVVAEALRRANAKRPSWCEGQREVEERFIERTRCVICARPLPDGHRRYCSDLCGSVAHNRKARLREANEQKAYDLMAGAR